ncbi:DJ-1/PfpI family protein [bacterium]|nr:DJ-1/PfpI family protein [bacterium]
MKLLRFFLIAAMIGKSLAAQSEVKSVSIFLFDGVQIIDYTGPYEVLGYGFNVFTVAQKMDTVLTNMGMKVIPDYDLEHCPHVNILLLPGGFGVEKTRQESSVITWIQERAKKADYVMSVCNGAFFLAKAGLLNGLEATTTAGYIDELQAEVPSARLVRNKRFVDNGKIITTAGLSSGIDGSLHIVGNIYGNGWSKVFARWLEFDWNPDSKYAAASLADCNTSNIMRLLLRQLDGTPLTFDGNNDRFESMVQINSKLSMEELSNQISKVLTENEKWNRIDPDKKDQGEWKFIGTDKKAWVGYTDIKRGKKADEFIVKITIHHEL